MLQIGAVALIIIAADESRSARGEEYDAKPPNAWKAFWSANRALLIFSKTDGLFTKCSWYLRDSWDDKGVNVTLHRYLVNHQYGYNQAYESWEFGEGNLATWFGPIGSRRENSLEYTHPDLSCGVVRYVEYNYANEELKNEKEGECDNDPDAERCQGERCCVINPKDETEYLCKDGPFYMLLVNENNKTDVPHNCTQFYDNIKGSKRDDKNEEIEGCTYLNDSCTNCRVTRKPSHST